MNNTIIYEWKWSTGEQYEKSVRPIRKEISQDSQQNAIQQSLDDYSYNTNSMNNMNSMNNIDNIGTINDNFIIENVKEYWKNYVYQSRTSKG
jgi:hypothetical protein